MTEWTEIEDCKTREKIMLINLFFLRYREKKRLTRLTGHHLLEFATSIFSTNNATFVKLWRLS